MKAWIARWWWACLAGIGGVCAVLVLLLVPRRREPQPEPRVRGDDAAREAADVEGAIDALHEDMKAIEDVLAHDDADDVSRAGAEWLNR